MNSLETISVFSIMTRDVKTEKEDQNVLTACRIMYENNIGCIIIVKSDNNNTKPVGIITERDIVPNIRIVKGILVTDVAPRHNE